MNLWQNFVRPKTVNEALLALREATAPVAAIAGGTDLLLDLDQGRHSPATTLVDLTSIAEMQKCEIRGQSLFVGAAVSLTAVARNPLVREHAQALVEACDLVGGPQVRNVATLGGNVAHALPAADGTIALVSLDAQVEVVDLSHSRRVLLRDIFIGPGKSALRAGEELIVGFHIPLATAGEASAFQRIMRPQGVALPILNMAVWLRRKGKLIHAARIAVGPSGPTPRRAAEAEAVLTGSAYSRATSEAALEALLKHVAFRTSPRRATAEYRLDLTSRLFEQTLERAWMRASE
jgi:CO/xanthine dehydrogenase FAD-binding subunit